MTNDDIADIYLDAAEFVYESALTLPSCCAITKCGKGFENMRQARLKSLRKSILELEAKRFT